MSYSFAVTESETFTVSHARHIACKVSSDLLRLQRLYGGPSDEMIDAYEEELIALLKYDYLDTVTYGFKRNGAWVIAVRYRAVRGDLIADDDPGRIRPRTDISGARFWSYLTYNSRWWGLSKEERNAFKDSLPFQRANGYEPGVENGYWEEDRSYSAGGRGLSRSTLRRW